jgi:hypothetical protein
MSIKNKIFSGGLPQELIRLCVSIVRQFVKAFTRRTTSFPRLAIFTLGKPLLGPAAAIRTMTAAAQVQGVRAVPGMDCFKHFTPV